MENWRIDRNDIKNQNMIILLGITKEQDGKCVPFTPEQMLEDDFNLAMHWIPCAGRDKEEFAVKLNIGQMNMLKSAIDNYKQEIKKWDDVEQQINSTSGYDEENCNAVLTAIRRVQEYIFNDKLSKEDVDHMNYHHCIGGTIQ